MRTRFMIISMLVMVVLLISCSSSTPPPPDPTPPPPSFTMRLNVDKPVYNIGENVIISAMASQECYLTLYDISTLGEVTQIFPNRFAEDNLIQGNQEYQIPTEVDRFNFEIGGPPGIERVRGVCTRKNVNLLGQRTRSTDEVFPLVSGTTAPFEESLDEELGIIPTDQWTETSVTFQVQ